MKLNDAGTGVDGLVLVEDEIADAVIDRTTTIFLYGLQCVGVVTNECVSTSINQLVRFFPLSDSGTCLMFPPPMKRYDDIRSWLCLAQHLHSVKQ